MAHRWGTDDHGPDGDPSWLGGKDRGGNDAPGHGNENRRSDGASSGSSSDTREGPSSDFSSSARGSAGRDFSTDFALDDGREPGRGTGFDTSNGRSDPFSAEEMTPRFAERAGEQSALDEEGSSWRSGFSSGSRQDSGSSRGTGAQVTGILTSVVVLLVFVVIARQVGFTMWWALLIAGIPLIKRVIRLVKDFTNR